MTENEQQRTCTPEEVQAKVAIAGELLIRAAAAIGTLTREQQQQIGELTEGNLTDCLAWALQGAASICPAVAESLRTHGPRGFIAMESRLGGAEPRPATVPTPPTCKQCGSPLDAAEYCSDVSCCYFDWPQAIPREDLKVFSAEEVEEKYQVKKRVTDPV